MTDSNVRSFAPFPKDVSLEDLVPEDHSYRRLEARLDLSFVREFVAPLYANGGRSSAAISTEDLPPLLSPLSSGPAQVGTTSSLSFRPMIGSGGDEVVPKVVPWPPEGS